MKTTLRLAIISTIAAVSAFSNASERGKGYPFKQMDYMTLKSHFSNPPAGYGTVPFYWWNGDSLTIERLSDQLDILTQAPVEGLSVSYIHTHPRVDVELNAEGYGSFGRADAGSPGVFSDGWWSLWNQFGSLCADKNVGLGLDDYVLGWAGNGYYVDEIISDPSFSNYQGRLKEDRHVLGPDSLLILELPANTISVTVGTKGKNLIGKSDKRDFRYKASKAGDEVRVIYTVPSYELHPDYGKKINETYFGRFEERLDGRARQSLNYFFQDELHYDLKINSWAEDMPEQFRKRKGYDIVPFLTSLFDGDTPESAKIRLDYADVLTQLAEERYFKPIYDWHAERGLIYGSDNNGRGMDPTQYLDYFRTLSWYTAPGNDAPARGSSFRQTKVSSSAAHLYDRPRTWLEAFHSMGWDSNGKWLTRQLDHHLVAGGNLLCMHGLYYSTHGGWWEWAPPCFFFRMPYWPHMIKWLEYGQKATYVLSQGRHVCDVAVLYPTETKQAFPKADIKDTWTVCDSLSQYGIDFDFIDFRSLKEARIKNGSLCVGDETYRVLVIPDAKAMHKETLEKIAEFAENGGIVISTSDKAPVTTSKSDKNVDKIWNGIFAGNHNGKVISAEAVRDIIGEMISPDFMVNNGRGKAYTLHRKMSDADLYMVNGASQGDTLRFRMTGKVERWNPADGSVALQPVIKATDEYTEIIFDGTEGESRYYVFSPGYPDYAVPRQGNEDLIGTFMLDGDWETEIIPTMHNKWGDYRLPAADEMIGPEAREFSFEARDTNGNILLSGVERQGFGPRFEMAVCDKDSKDEYVTLLMSDSVAWTPYEFSWQYGVEDNPGSQGYHGLKGKVDNRFLILDKGMPQLFRTHFYVADEGEYEFIAEGKNPAVIVVDGKEMYDNEMLLSSGWHTLGLAYDASPKREFILEKMKSDNVDFRDRSMVVILPKCHTSLKNNDPYGDIVASKWYDSETLPYSILPFAGDWKYEFATPPGALEMTMEVNGEINEVYIDGNKTEFETLDSGKYKVGLDPSATMKSVDVRLIAKPDYGNEGGSFFEQPVRFKTGKGLMEAKDWTEIPGMKYFSGGVRYKKSFDIDTVDFNQAILEIAEIDATCEISVNGHNVATLISPPWKIDIARWLHSGENDVEITVYSTLANHYQTIPSAYRGTPSAGMTGPVKIQLYR